MVRNRRASWLRSSTCNTSVLSGVSIAFRTPASAPPDQQFARGRFIGDEDIAIDQFDGAEQCVDLFIAAGGDDPLRHIAQLTQGNRNDAAVDRMVDELAVAIVEIEQKIADG